MVYGRYTEDERGSADPGGSGSAKKFVQIQEGGWYEKGLCKNFCIDICDNICVYIFIIHLIKFFVKVFRNLYNLLIYHYHNPIDIILFYMLGLFFYLQLR